MWRLVEKETAFLDLRRVQWHERHAENGLVVFKIEAVGLVDAQLFNLQ